VRKIGSGTVAPFCAGLDDAGPFERHFKSAMRAGRRHQPAAVV